MFGLFANKKAGFKAQSNSAYENITNSHELAQFLENGLGRDTFTGEKVGDSEAMRVAAVNRCINIRAGVMASAPIHVRHKGTFKELPHSDDIVFLLNERPNKNMNAYTLRRVMDMQKQLHGNAYARVIWRDGRRGRSGKVLAVEFMDQSRVQVKQLDDRSLEYSYTRDNGSKLVLMQDEVLHVMGPSTNGVMGQSIIGHARNQIGLSVASERHMSGLYRNGTSIGLFFKIMRASTAQTKEAIEVIKQSLEQFRGSKESHKAMVLPNGIEPESIPMSRADAEFVLSRKLSIIEICMFFGVPPHIVGFNEGQIYGNGVEHTGISFVNFTLRDDFRAWEAALRHVFIGDDRDYMIDLDDSNLMRGDVKSRWHGYKIAREVGAMSANDINKSERRPNVTGGDDYWTQPNLSKGNANDIEESA